MLSVCIIGFSVFLGFVLHIHRVQVFRQSLHCHIQRFHEGKYGLDNRVTVFLPRSYDPDQSAYYQR